jgi:phenylacetate-CoA ligase
MALYLLDAGRDDIRPKAVFTSSETLLGYWRKAIERAFNCKAYSFYDSREACAQILECPLGNYHIMTDTCFVEVLNQYGLPSKTGELGELICTGFVNKLMPFIRYRIGDSGIATHDPCPCGRNTPILTDLTGRTKDLIVTPEGRQISFLEFAFMETPFVKETQIVQDEVDSLLVNVTPRPEYNFDKDEKKIREGFKHLIGPSMKIRIEYVDHIPREPNGKFRYMISKIPTQTHNRYEQKSGSS